MAPLNVGLLFFIAWLAFYNLSVIFLHKRSAFLKLFDKNHLQRQFDVGDKEQIVVADLT
ncbi:MULTISPECIES: hypothetical protein [unclassified Gilliamella]|uniref:hypothetical protein n=1 Tax=unclassified Gilliamella TaxID=2685620 RepID=UPI0013242560|nr:MULTISPECIES: hypothetical protein [unclassified Gilliamella]MWP50167.1 hypothetical protein [Gilliamella sp. Lep-s35]MWP76914.1 hypothetical protein [Gilliamella sp. Lep-s21]